MYKKSVPDHFCVIILADFITDLQLKLTKKLRKRVKICTFFFKVKLLREYYVGDTLLKISGNMLTLSESVPKLLKGDSEGNW